MHAAAKAIRPYSPKGDATEKFRLQGSQNPHPPDANSERP